GEVLDELLLIGALEVETTDITTRRHLVVADLDHVEAIGDLLPHGLAAVEHVAALLDAGDLYGFADLDGAGIRLLLAGNHAQQGRLTSTVAADHADDGAFGD